LEFNFVPYFCTALPALAGKTKTSLHDSEKKVSRRRMACVFYFRSSISLCNHQPLALANAYYSIRYYVIRLGDGYRLMPQA